MTYSVTVREYEMGEQPFVENRHDTLGEALDNASALMDRYLFGDLGDETLDSWVIVDPTDSGCEFIVTFVLNNHDHIGEEYSTDYIIEVRNDD